MTTATLLHLAAGHDRRLDVLIREIPALTVGFIGFEGEKASGRANCFTQKGMANLISAMFPGVSAQAPELPQSSARQLSLNFTIFLKGMLQ